MTEQDPAHPPEPRAWTPKERTSPPEPRDGLADWSRDLPIAIIVYFVLLAALRLSFSDFLEVDEAEFLGQVDFRLLYENSHPPLFNWILRVVLELTGWDWAFSVTLVKFGLLAAFHWLVWDSAERLSGRRAALLAVAASALLPQIVWMSVFTLAHSVMVMTGAAAAVNATLRAIETPSRRSFVWIGLAGALCALGKFNGFLFLIPFVGAVLAEPSLRAALLVGRRAWLAPAVFLAAVGPVLIALALDWSANSGRMAKLYGGSGPLAAVDVDGIGIDGALSLVVALAAWAAAAAAVWTAARRLDRPRADFEADATDLGRAFVRALGRAMLGALGLFLLIVLVGDIHKVHERYLTPLLAPLPIYLAVRWPLARSGGVVAALAGAAYLAVPIGLWAAVTYGKHRYGYPYPEVAAQVARQSPTPLPILASRHDDAANVVLALGWPGAATPAYQPIEDQAILLWQGRSAAPDGLAPPGFAPGGPIITVVAPFLNAREGTMVFRFQLFDRLPAGAELLREHPGQGGDVIEPAETGPRR